MTHRFLMNKIAHLTRRVHSDLAEVVLFLRTLAVTKGQHNNASQSENTTLTAQQVVTDFFLRRMQHHDVMQRRESQIIFNRVLKAQTMT